jgi:hypothetical protein
VRRLFVLVILVFLAAAPVIAQADARVEVQLAPDSITGPHARVRVRSLLSDPSWRNAITNSYPVRLEWTLQLWQRGGGFLGLAGKAGPKVEWKEMIQRNSILGVYELTTDVAGEHIAPQQFSSIEVLAYEIARPLDLVDFAPRSPGNWYYRVTLKLSTLTEDEITKLDRFSSSTQRGDADPGALQRLINRVLLNINLPSATLTDESPVFRWR